MKTIVRELQDAIQFFQTHAGWCSPPGKMACAFALAKAEADAELLGMRFEWFEDEEGCLGCTCGDKRCKCSTGEAHEVLCCVARDAQGRIVASLGGICEPSHEYKRVVEAELAQEAL